MAEGIQATEQDKELARNGIRTQLEWRGLLPLLEDEKFADFIDNQVNVISQLRAEERMLRSVLHKELNDG